MINNTPEDDELMRLINDDPTTPGPNHWDDLTAELNNLGPSERRAMLEGLDILDKLLDNQDS